MDNSWIQNIILLSSALTALVGIWKLLIVPLHGSYKNLSKIYTSLDTHLPKIIKISNELDPNGGNSIKDILTRIDKNTQGSISRIWTLLESTEFGYFETNRHGEYIRVNKAWLRLAKMDSEESKGNGWINGIAPEDRDRVFYEWELAVKQERAFSSIYTMSSNIQVKADAHPIKTDSGEVLGWLGYLEEVA
jgi:hypothetical protein